MIFGRFCVTIQSDTSKGASILTIIIGLWFVFQPHPQVAGAEIIKADPNHPVEIFYGSVAYKNVQEMISEAGITVYPEDKVETVPPPELGIGSKIIITRATPIQVIDAKKSKTYHTWQTTVAGILKEKKIELLGKDSVSPTLKSPISYAMKVTITRVAEVEVTENQPIAFKKLTKNSVDLERGQTEIQTKGINGEKKIIYLVKRVDGEEVSRSVIDTSVVEEPVSEVKIIGIGPKLAKSGPYKDTINAAAKEYLINGTALMCLMLTESGGSADTGYPDGDYKGLFQYTDGYWADASAAAGYGGSSIYNAEAQIFSTARALTHGQSGRWPPWSRCSSK